MPYSTPPAKATYGLPKVLLGGGYYGERYRNLSWIGFLVFIWTVAIGFVTAYNALHKFLENRKDKLVETTVRNILLDILEQIKKSLEVIQETPTKSILHE